MESTKMRVYEFAKQVNLPSKELIKMLKDGGFQVGNHMSVLDQKALDFLNKKFKKPTPDSAKDQGQIKKMAAPQKFKSKKSVPHRAPRKAAKQPLRKKGAPAVSVKKEQKKEPVSQVVEEKKEIVLVAATPADVSKSIGVPATDIIVTLLKWGIVCPKNQLLPKEIVERLAHHYEVTTVKAPEKEEEAVQKVTGDVAVKKEKFEDRMPVVVVMGHVDHGKTTLLDFIRNTRVAAKEKGGITQHLGAYEVKTDHGGIAFLDTPGHEAFTKIRIRGAKVADIVVIVIAADDSIMPQTQEAIRHAKNMNVPIIVAINKIDKVEQHQIEAVKRDLSQHDLLPEDWGGQIVCVPISAKLGQGVDQLLEMISLQAQMLELTADKTAPAHGYILESKLEKGRGPVATLICRHGTIKKSDFFVCGDVVGRVTSLVNSYGKKLKSAGPSVPVRVAGFSELPEAGDFLRVVSQKEYKKARSAKPEKRLSATQRPAEGAFNILVKVDTKSSREALLGAIEKLSKKLEKGFHVTFSSVGDINESDVALAATTNSMIVGLHVKAEPNAVSLARRDSVDVRQFDIIYRLIEDLEAFAESKKEIKKVKTKIGEAVVLRVFDIKNIGVIAGCAVKDGRCSRDGSLVIWRGKEKIGEGKIRSLQREKKAVKEVHAGFECGFLVENFNDWQVDDRVECYIELAPEKK